MRPGYRGRDGRVVGAASGTHSETVTQKANRVVPVAAAFAAILPLPDGMEVIEPRGSARRLAIKMSGPLLVALLLGVVRRHSVPSDLLLTAAAPMFYGWWVGRVLVISRRVEGIDRQLHGTLLAAAGPFEACGGKRRLFAVRPPLP